MKTKTPEELIRHKLVSYERTREDALEAARDHFEETGRKCFVVNPRGVRARKRSSEKPWQVRESVVEQ